jgi:hypothetical protein
LTNVEEGWEEALLEAVRVVRDRYDENSKVYDL